VRAIRKAIDASAELSARSLQVFIQGSYADRTNVRQDSDVDVCILHNDVFYTDYSHTKGLNDAVLGFTDAPYHYATFKNDVESALVSYFGRPAVCRGKKAFDIRENTYRVDADVVPCFEHRLYSGDQSSYFHLAGTQLFPDNGGKIINWPKQNYDNGIAKNDRTGQKFKAVTRIMKNLCFELMENGDKVAEKIPSYLIECLAWNVPDPDLTNGILRQSVGAAIAYLWRETRVATSCDKWTEVNGIKYLFHPSQPWRREDVNAFLVTAWNFIGFK
jgi:hypothetical protein